MTNANSFLTSNSPNKSNWLTKMDETPTCAGTALTRLSYTRTAASDGIRTRDLCSSLRIQP